MNHLAARVSWCPRMARNLIAIQIDVFKASSQLKDSKGQDWDDLEDGEWEASMKKTIQTASLFAFEDASRMK